MFVFVEGILLFLATLPIIRTMVSLKLPRFVYIGLVHFEKGGRFLLTIMTSTFQPKNPDLLEAQHDATSPG